MTNGSRRNPPSNAIAIAARDADHGLTTRTPLPMPCQAAAVQFIEGLRADATARKKRPASRQAPEHQFGMTPPDPT